MKSRKRKKIRVPLLCLILFSVAVFCLAENTTRNTDDSAAQPGNEMHFHGRRVLSDSTEFYVTRILILSGKNNILTLDITFSLPIDPGIFDYSQIKINNVSVPDEANIKFNRAGNSFRLSFVKKNLDKDVFSIDLPNIKSFNQKDLVNTHFENILTDVEFLYKNYEEGMN